MIGWIVLFVIVSIAISPLVGRHLRRARKQQTRPVLYPPLVVVRDEPLDLAEAHRRGRQ